MPVTTAVTTCQKHLTHDLQPDLLSYMQNKALTLYILNCMYLNVLNLLSRLSFLHRSVWTEYLLKARSTNGKFSYSNNDLSDISLTRLKCLLAVFANVKANGPLWSSPWFSRYKKRFKLKGGPTWPHTANFLPTSSHFCRNLAGDSHSLIPSWWPYFWLSVSLGVFGWFSLVWVFFACLGFFFLFAPPPFFFIK